MNKLSPLVQNAFRATVTPLAASLLLVAVAPRAAAQVVLSELMYNPISGNTAEFVELHNAGTNAVDVGGWYFTDGITTPSRPRP